MSKDDRESRRSGPSTLQFRAPKTDGVQDSRPLVEWRGEARGGKKQRKNRLNIATIIMDENLEGETSGKNNAATSVARGKDTLDFKL